MRHSIVLLFVMSASLFIPFGGCTVVDLRLMTLDSDLLPIIPDGVVSRAITWENRTGEPGAGGKARGGRKGSPCIPLIKNGETVTLMDIEGCGVIRHIWITIPDRSPEALRNMILRMYWDGCALPSVEAPVGDFFGMAHGRTAEMTTAYTTMTLGRGFNCFFPMPFATHAKITITNDMPDGREMRAFFFQIDYELRDRLPPSTGRFHAQFRRQNPTVEKRDYVVLDGVEGPGMFIGCVIGVRALSEDWWGEGEMKFYMDGDTDYPTICGTGTEDYFCAAWGMGLYQTPWHGCTLNLRNDYFKHPLVSMYRLHAKDPVHFRQSFRATIQQIGWRRPDGLFERSDDWCSLAYWYQLKPNRHVPPLPDRNARTADILEPKEEGAEQ
ncbi:MAG: glycoside hydrolase family 172 protein [Phycisphaerae bacterium]